MHARFFVCLTFVQHMLNGFMQPHNLPAKFQGCEMYNCTGPSMTRLPALGFGWPEVGWTLLTTCSPQGRCKLHTVGTKPARRLLLPQFRKPSRLCTKGLCSIRVGQNCFEGPAFGPPNRVCFIGSDFRAVLQDFASHRSPQSLEASLGAWTAAPLLARFRLAQATEWTSLP